VDDYEGVERDDREGSLNVSYVQVVGRRVEVSAIATRAVAFAPRCHTMTLTPANSLYFFAHYIQQLNDGGAEYRCILLRAGMNLLRALYHTPASTAYLRMPRSYGIKLPSTLRIHH